MQKINLVYVLIAAISGFFEPQNTDICMITEFAYAINKLRRTAISAEFLYLKTEKIREIQWCRNSSHSGY